jgi:hypothetical protein
MSFCLAIKPWMPAPSAHMTIVTRREDAERYSITIRGAVFCGAPETFCQTRSAMARYVSA